MTREKLYYDPTLVANHLDQVRSLSQASHVAVDSRAKVSVVSAFDTFLLRTARDLAWTLLLAPATVFVDPVGTIAAALLWPVINTALAVVCAAFWLGGKVGLGRVIDDIGATWASGYSVPNWPGQDLFADETVTAFHTARPILQGDVPTTEHMQHQPTTRLFSVPLARVFLAMSAIVYERDDALLAEAAREQENAGGSDSDEDGSDGGGRDSPFLASSQDVERYMADRTAVASTGGDGIGADVSGPDTAHASEAAVAQFANAVNAVAAKPRAETKAALRKLRAEVKLVMSMQAIKLWAAKLGLAFDGVSEMAPNSSAFASIFAPPIGSGLKPFIVLCFKGTTPLDYAEWLVDASVSKTGASVWFGPGSGAAHEGFFYELFGRPNSAVLNGYETLLSSVKDVARRMKATGGGRLAANEKVPLWLCGQSLGAALASLCYARFLHSEKDLGDDLQLCDCYAFGTPRIGNGDFASAFEASLVSPIDRSVILWRVINHFDILANVPLGLADAADLRTNFTALSILNYAHLGPSITLRPACLPWLKPFYELGNLTAFPQATRVKVIGGHSDEKPWPQVLYDYISARGKNPFRWLWSMLPAQLYNHFPADYNTHLRNILSSA